MDWFERNTHGGDDSITGEDNEWDCKAPGGAYGLPTVTYKKPLFDYHPFGSKEYSKEELIAEIGAAFLCGIAGIKNEIIDNSASYIQSWLYVLKDRKNVKLIVIDTGQAQKVVDYITKDSYESDLIHF